MAYWPAVTASVPRRAQCVWDPAHSFMSHSGSACELLALSMLRAAACLEQEREGAGGVALRGVPGVGTAESAAGASPVTQCCRGSWPRSSRLLTPRRRASRGRPEGVVVVGGLSHPWPSDSRAISVAERRRGVSLRCVPGRGWTGLQLASVGRGALWLLAWSAGGGFPQPGFPVQPCCLTDRFERPGGGGGPFPEDQRSQNSSWGAVVTWPVSWASHEPGL